MVPDKKLANAVAGKTARACDNCIRNRARWYCAADDAFLCQPCDASVHSANSLARRHERIRLKTASFRNSDEDSEKNTRIVPPWHNGFTRKARTPRCGSKHHRPKSDDEPTPNLLQYLVPDQMSGEEAIHDEDNEEQLLYKVPTYDHLPVSLGFGELIDLNEAATTVESNAALNGSGEEVEALRGFALSEIDIGNFEADVECLLGNGLDDGSSFDMGSLGLLDCHRGEACVKGTSLVKVEAEGGMEADARTATRVDCGKIYASGEQVYELNFDHEIPDEIGAEEIVVENDEESDVGNVTKGKILLSLDYDGVISAWSHVTSPWTNGERPELDPNECCWPSSTSASDQDHLNGEMVTMRGKTTMADRGREAKVKRYREKRRKRLFSKKIRYEVRKVNAEKRPRIKGRFVKRTSFTDPAFA